MGWKEYQLRLQLVGRRRSSGAGWIIVGFVLAAGALLFISALVGAR